MFRRAIPVLVLLLFSVRVPAQDRPAQDRPVTDSSRERHSDSVFVMQKSPWGAVLRSAIIPGWGQLYNESYWKIPVVVGLTAFLVSGIVREHSRFADYRDLYAATITTANPYGDLRYKQYREFYRDNRDTYAWWLLVLYLVQAADAFVDAHLYDFNVTDTVHANLLASPRGSLTLQLRW
jgi:hypothetical protein